MSPIDRNHEAVPPEQARSLDALIASHTDTSIDEAQADRLLSFLTEGMEVADAAQGWSAKTSPTLVAVVGLGLGFAAAALFYFLWSPGMTRPEESPVTIVSASPEAASPVPGASSAIRVRGVSKKSRKPVDRDRMVMAAWQGQWMPDLQLSDLRQATREACAAACPWPLSDGARWSGSAQFSQPGWTMRPVDTGANLEHATMLRSQGLGSNREGSNREGSNGQRVVMATRWLLRRVADGALPMSELHVPGRVLIASRGRLRQRLVELFRSSVLAGGVGDGSGLRLERLAWMRGQEIPAQTVELLAAVGVEASIKRLARMDAGIHGRIVQQALSTAIACRDARSLGFLVDFLVLAHRRQPDSDGIRMAPLVDLQGTLWKHFVEIVSRQATHRARYPDRLFLESLRAHLISRT